MTLAAIKPKMIVRSWSRALLAAVGASAVAETAVANSHIDLSIGYTSDLLANMDGGIKRGTALLGLIELMAELDGAAIGIDGATAFLNLQLPHGCALSEELVGDAQVVSNIEAVSALRPFEAWIELPLAGDQAALKMGLVDLNGEFDVQSVGALFLNSSHGIGPEFSQSGLNGPSIFPVTSGALVLRGSSRGWTARLGLFDAVAGDPDRPKRTRVGYPGRKGLLAVAEVERSLGDASAVKAGVWTYSTRFDALNELDVDGNPRRISGNRGAYATLEGRLAGNADRALDGWLRVGVAEARINPISTAIGGGFAWGSDAGRFGLAVSHARLGNPGKRAAIAEGLRPQAAETNIEVTYSMAVAPGLTVQPDVQYAIDPGWRSDLDDALVAGVRVIVELP